jgi:PAS domain S-box-containing protein
LSNEIEYGSQGVTGEPAAGMRDDTSFSPTGTMSAHHWKSSNVSKPGLDDRGSVFFAAIQMTRMPMILTDPRQDDNPIVFANKAFLDLTGYEENEIVGRNCRFLQGPATDRNVVRSLRNAVEAREAISIEILNYRRDGSAFWNAVFIAPVYDEAGELIYFFASQLDVSRRRDSEQAFRQAQKMEAIGQLTAGLAHDFNNLLQVVSGNLAILLEQELSERQRRLLESAAGAADRGAKLTRQLLAFARKTRLEPQKIDLNELIDSAGDLIDNTVGPQVRLVTSFERRLPPVELDPTHLEMALMNVLINSRDAMPQGGKVHISTELWKLNGNAAAYHLTEGDYVVLTVKDEGEGMPADVLDRATEPFFTTKSSEKGTGLGLAMVHGFVQQSLGRLEIESSPGAGTEIRMIFPAASGDRPSLPVPSTGASERTSRGAGETILLVEDSEDVRSLAEVHLQTLGYRVIAVPNGEQALEVIADNPEVELLFTDIVMPGGMSGLELAKRVGSARPTLPILLTTGYNDDLANDVPAGTQLDVIGKPYTRSELGDRISNALKHASSAPRRLGSPFGAAEE